MWDGSVGLGTSLPDVQARYYGSHIVTDNISLYSTTGRPCLGPIRFILALVAMNLGKHMNPWNIKITRKCTGKMFALQVYE
jgi:hypothetical protein